MKLSKWLIFPIVLLASLLFISPVQAAENFVIENMYVELNVEESGLIHVEQILNVDFSTSSHGIYFNIPTRYEMTWNVDGEPVKRNYYFPVTNINVVNHEYNIDKQSNGIQVRIGDPDEYVNGKQTYTISYDMQTMDLRLKGRQKFYQNLIDNWDTEVRSADIVINMPKSFDLDSVYFYVGFDSNNSNYDGFSYSIDGNTIHANLSEPLSPNHALTIDIDVPNGYFVFPEPFDFTWIIIIFAVVLMLGSIIVFFLYGKDGLVIKTVMFDVPEGLTCASLSYVADGQIKANDVICLIIEWANLGYLRIEEVDSKDIRLYKLQNMGNERTKYERRLFLSIFKDSDFVLTSQLSETFYQNITKCFSDIKAYFRSSKERRIFAKNSLVFKSFTILLAALPIFVGVLNSAYEYFYDFSLVAVIGITMYVLTLGVIALWQLIVTNRLITKSWKMLLYCIGNGLLSLLIIALYYLFVYIGNQNYLIFAVTCISTIITTLCALFMDKRTERGMKLYGEILGLKDFIETAEKDRLEALVQDNPQYFYHILPYAYVLGVSDVWSKKFSDIVMENASWYATDEYVPVYLFMPRFYRTMTTLNENLYHIAQIETSSGGGSFGGGGGGGFSGGGFGGGGGGSW